MNQLYTAWQEIVNERNNAFNEYQRAVKRNAPVPARAATLAKYKRARASADRAYTTYIVYADQELAA